MTISGKGKGAVVVGSTYASETTAGVTTQSAGRTVLASEGSVTFALEIAQQNGFNMSAAPSWTSLIPGIGLSKAIINATNFSVSTGILTVDFDFMFYVV